MGRPADGGIGAAGTPMENQLNGPAATASEQFSGNPLMGPVQITAAPGRDHQRAGRGNLLPRRSTESHGFSCRKDN